jgi:hypothetical protein
MKKTIAAISASVLGLSGALVATAAPAGASTPDCTSKGQHNVSATADGTQDWYMDCIPLYGLGKAEIGISTTAAKPFPAGYSLGDGHQTVTSNIDETAASAYFGSPATGAFLDLAEPDAGNTPTHQRYSVSAIFPIASVAKSTAPLAPECTAGNAVYDGVYVITYEPTTTHFSEKIGTKTWTATVATTPSPMTLALNFAGGNIDPGNPICVTSNGSTRQLPNDTNGNWTVAARNQATNSVGTNSSSLDPYSDLSRELGDFATTVSSPAATDTSDSDDPELAATGLDPRGPLAAALAFLLAGGLAFGFRRRRRTR